MVKGLERNQETSKALGSVDGAINDDLPAPADGALAPGSACREWKSRGATPGRSRMDLGKIRRRLPSLAALDAWRRIWKLTRTVAAWRSCGTEAVQLYYSPEPWYVENAAVMLRIADDTARRLTRELGLTFPRRPLCGVTTPAAAEAIQNSLGAAYETCTLIGVPERQLSTFAATAAHELAHLLSRSLRPYPCSFMAEGFACFAAARIGVERRPCGLPLHYHLVWMLGVGIRLSLAELWERADYTCELYDLAWSFATFVEGSFGRERYFALYRSEAPNVEEQVAAALGTTARRLEREWFEHARSEVTVPAREISRMRRYAGSVCSRAAWLSAQSR